MKTIKSLTEAELAEYPSLPAGWQWTRLGEIADNIQYGYTESSSDEPIGPKFLRITDIQNNGVNWKSVPYCKIDDAKKQNYLLKERDLVFARTGATVGKSYLLKGDFPESVFASYLIRVRLLKEVSESFVYNFFQSLIYWKQITEGQVGIGQPNVNGTKLSMLIVPVAPLPEQRAIVSKIEQLFSELDNGIANLKLAQEQLKVYRQAVLKKAFEGELTRKWREQQIDLPDARDIVEQIRKERVRIAKTDIMKYKVDEKQLISINSTGNLFNLPYSWKWIRLEEILTFGPKNGYSPKPVKHATNVRTLTLTATTSGKFRDDCFKYIDEEIDANSYLWLEENDILIQRGNTIEYVGVAAIYKGSSNSFIYPDLMVKIRIHSKVNVKFLHFFINSEFSHRYFKKRATGTAGSMPKINHSTIVNLPIPFPSLAEQHRIVFEIERRFSVIDQIEQDIETNLEKAEALRQSILKKAFEGKLLNEKELAEVRKAEDWEPAEVLLERIKAENAGYKKKLENW